MANPPLTAQTALVHTASVEVRALTIQGKQVTLSVFRQLQEKDLVNEETGELNGTPWGFVNYFWSGAERCDAIEIAMGCDSPARLHVVWQDGLELKRALVTPSWEQTASGRRQMKLVNELFGECAVAAVLSPGFKLSSVFSRLEADSSHRGHEATVDIYGAVVSAEELPLTCGGIPNVMRAVLIASPLRAADWRTDNRVELLECWLGERGLTNDDLSELTYLLLVEAGLADNRRRKWSDRYKELSVLPQLFIAV